MSTLDPSALGASAAELPRHARGLTTADIASFGQIYEQLKPHAHRLLASRRGETLNTTGLVHEAFLKLLQHAAGLNDQRHLYRLAVLAMRQILLDRARVKDADRHGGDYTRITLTGLPLIDPLQPFDVLLFDSTLDQLRKLDARKAEVFELHVLAGLELKQIATLVAVAEITVRRDFRAACTLVGHWLQAN